MKVRNIITKITVTLSLAAVLTTSAIWEVRRARAATDINVRGLFGMVGITRGQTLRVNVVNLVTVPAEQYPPDPCRVVLSFRNAQGQPFTNSDGQPIRRTVELQAGESAFLDLNGDQLGGIGTNGPGRVQLRPFVRVLQSPGDNDPQLPPDPCFPTAEVFGNATLQTSFVLPGVEVAGGFNHNETLVRDLGNRKR
jgi:hypothetical protein